MELHDVGISPVEEGAVERGGAAVGRQVEQISEAGWAGLVPVDGLEALAAIRHKVVLVTVRQLAAVDVQIFPLSLHPFRERASRLGRGLHRCRGRSRRLKLLEVKSFIAVLGGVEVVGASGVAREGHVRQAGVGILFEKLQQNE